MQLHNYINENRKLDRQGTENSEFYWMYNYSHVRSDNCQKFDVIVFLMAHTICMNMIENMDTRRSYTYMVIYIY